MEENENQSSPPLVGRFYIEAEGIQRGEEVGAIGLELTTNKGRFLREPWGLICNVILNQPIRAKLMHLPGILQLPKRVSTPVQKLIALSNNRTLISSCEFQKTVHRDEQPGQSLIPRWQDCERYSRSPALCSIGRDRSLNLRST